MSGLCPDIVVGTTLGYAVKMHVDKLILAFLLVFASPALQPEVIASEYKVPPGIISQPESEPKQEEAPPEEVKPKFYRKVNPDGSVEFTDVPDRDTREIELAPVPTTKIAPVPAVRFSPFQTPQAAKKYQYKRFEIVSPLNDATIRDNTGNITIQATIDPRLIGAHKINWYLDGDLISNKTGLSLVLSNLDRGSHTVVAKILTHKDEILQQTPTVTFHLMRFFKKPAP